MKLDAKGNLWVAAGINHPRGNPGESLDVPAGVYVISPAGKLLGRIPIPEDLLTNVAFGGPKMDTLFITGGIKGENDSEGGFFKIELPGVKGLVILPSK